MIPLICPGSIAKDREGEKELHRLSKRSIVSRTAGAISCLPVFQRSDNLSDRSPMEGSVMRKALSHLWASRTLVSSG